MLFRSEILAALSKVCGLEYLKIIATQLADLIIGPVTLGSLRRLCIVVEAMTELEIQQGALPRLESLQLLCKNLDGFCHAAEIQSLPRLSEVALHNGVNSGTKQKWKEAAKSHPRRPKLLFVKSTEEVDVESEPATPTTGATLPLKGPHGAISTRQSGNQGLCIILCLIATLVIVIGWFSETRPAKETAPGLSVAVTNGK